jgi:hypothetical protein
MIYACAGFDTASPPGPAALLRAILGDHAAEWIDDARGSGAWLVYDRDRWRVCVSRDLRDHELCLALGRVVIRLYIYTATPPGRLPPLYELLAELLIPEAALGPVVEDHGADHIAVAAHFRVPESLAIHRLRRFASNSGSGQFERVVRAG